MNSILKILFWDPRRSEENSAQTLIRVLGNLIRSFISLSILATALIVSAYYVAEFFNSENRALKNTYISVEYDPEFCNSENPISVAIENESNKSITNVRFNVEARLQNRSSNLIEWSSRIRANSNDIIIEPGFRYRFCTNYTLQNNASPEEVIWSGQINSLDIWLPN